MTDSSSDVTSTLKRKPSSVSSTNSEDSPVVGKPKPNKQEKKKQRFVSEEFTDGEEENEQNMESTVTTLDVLSKKLDSLATKDDINQFRAEIQRVIDSLHNKVDKMEGRVFDVEAENDKLKTEIRKIQENNKDLKNRIDQYDKENRQLRRNQNDHEQYLRRWNCRVYKVPEEEGETANSCIKKCATVFTKDIGVKVTEADIDVAHRIGPPPPKGRSRPIIVRFLSRQARDLVVSNRKNLKNKGVAVGEDLTKANYSLLLAAEKHSATLAAWSSNGKILSKLKNGRIIRVDIDMDINAVFKKGLSHKGSEDDSVTGK